MLRVFSFTDVDRDRDSSFLEETFFFGGDLDLFGGDLDLFAGDLDLDVTRTFLVRERDRNVDCVPAPGGLLAAGRLAGDLDADRFLGGERFGDSERRA